MSGWTEAALPSLVAQNIQPGSRLYFRNVADGQLRLIASPPGAGRGWHLSISHAFQAGGVASPGRYPTWDEIRDARYEFAPDGVTMAMLLPPSDEYVNVHETTFHLHEIDPNSVLR